MISEGLLGRIVYSKKGRDAGKTFVVVKEINDQYVIVADGDLRKIDNPKLKNIRHLQLTNLVAEELAEILSKGEIPADHLIRKTIRNLLENSQSTGKEVW